MELILCIVAALVLFELLPILAIVAMWLLAIVFLKLVNFYRWIFGSKGVVHDQCA